MDKDYDILAQKVAEYVGVVQPQLDELKVLRKTAEAEKSAKAAFARRATEAIGALADSGLVSRNDVTSLIDKSAEDPSVAWDLVEKAAAAIRPADLGHQSDEKTASAASQDPWVREFGGYNKGADNGIIY